MNPSTPTAVRPNGPADPFEGRFDAMLETLAEIHVGFEQNQRDEPDEEAWRTGEALTDLARACLYRTTLLFCDDVEHETANLTIGGVQFVKAANAFLLGDTPTAEQLGAMWEMLNRGAHLRLDGKHRTPREGAEHD
ncbi:MAG: hypothetical protein QOJ13_3409 [Gaiellales bacterium]|jgi:hypothetical protein|nr:hypothetical protein [Gaiellales bacterium]